MSDLTPDKRARQLVEIRARAERARMALSDIARCEFMRITPTPYSHREVAASQADVPALLDALDAAEARSAAVEALAERWETARNLNTGEPSIVTQAFAAEVRAALAGDLP